MLYSETKIGDVRSSKALADELLVWAWINPKKVNPTLEGRQWVAAGYETRVTLVGGRSDPAPYLAEWSDTINLVSYNWKASVCTQQISSLMQFDQAVPEIIV